MTRRLFNTDRSPFGRKVRIILVEKGLPFDTALVDWNARSAEFTAVSPLGKVPVLVDEDGTVIFDSTVIVEYLEDTHPVPPMLGVGARERLLHRELDELGDHIADQAVVAFYAKSRGDSDAERTSLERVRKALAEATRRIARGAVPSTFGTGHAALIAGIGYLVLRHGAGLVDEHPELAAWLRESSERASVASTTPNA
jgi:glutathione S-transferase